MFTTQNKECAKDKCHDMAHKAGQKVHALVETAQHEARDATATVIKEVRSKPLQASAIAAGIGFLFGLLMRRR